MRSLLKLVLLCCLLMMWSVASAQYVRKKLKPTGFFIPESELEEKEYTVPIVKYYSGNENTVAVKTKPKPQPSKVVTPLPTPTIDNEASPQSPLPDTTPDYQQVYQEYLKDIDKVSKGKKLPPNQQLNNDLAKMDSNQRILADKEFNKRRGSVIDDFNNAL